jgi:hypothetical protein
MQIQASVVFPGFVGRAKRCGFQTVISLFCRLDSFIPRWALVSKKKKFPVGPAEYTTTKDMKPILANDFSIIF